MRKILLFISVITLFCFAKCRKDREPDPNSFYFRCKIDGQLYVPGSMDAKLLSDTTILINGNSGFESVAFWTINITGQPIIATSYILNDNPRRGGDYKTSTTTTDKFSTDATRTGELTISTLDKTKKIISGTFYFQGYNPIQNKTVNITEGKFRVNYITE
jgi:hypothetical protein